MLMVSRIRDAFFNAFPSAAGVSAEDVRRQIKELSSQARLAAFIAPFAKAASSESLTNVYTRTFERAAFGFAKMYLFCLFMRVLLSWFPSIDWNAQPWTFLRLITEPYLQIYRGLLPPVFGGLDFTPLIGFMILQDVVEVMAPTYTMGMHAADTSTKWTTSDVMCYFDGF
jgi:YggT family protein